MKSGCPSFYMKCNRLRVAEPTGLEPATSDVTGRRSNQLNYDSAFKRDVRCQRSDVGRGSALTNLRHLISDIRIWWARRDSNPQPLPCKGSRLPLTYVPEKSFQRSALSSTLFLFDEWFMLREGTEAVKASIQSLTILQSPIFPVIVFLLSLATGLPNHNP